MGGRGFLERDLIFWGDAGVAPMARAAARIQPELMPYLVVQPAPPRVRRVYL
jgi:hypothetical protein